MHQRKKNQNKQNCKAIKKTIVQQINYTQQLHIPTYATMDLRQAGRSIELKKSSSKKPVSRKSRCISVKQTGVQTSLNQKQLLKIIKSMKLIHSKSRSPRSSKSKKKTKKSTKKFTVNIPSHPTSHPPSSAPSQKNLTAKLQRTINKLKQTIKDDDQDSQIPLISTSQAFSEHQRRKLEFIVSSDNLDLEVDLKEMRLFVENGYRLRKRDSSGSSAVLKLDQGYFKGNFYQSMARRIQRAWRRYRTRRIIGRYVGIGDGWGRGEEGYSPYNSQYINNNSSISGGNTYNYANLTNYNINSDPNSLNLTLNLSNLPPRDSQPTIPNHKPKPMQPRPQLHSPRHPTIPIHSYPSQPLHPHTHTENSQSNPDNISSTLYKEDQVPRKITYISNLESLSDQGMGIGGVGAGMGVGMGMGVGVGNGKEGKEGRERVGSEGDAGWGYGRYISFDDGDYQHEQSAQQQQQQQQPSQQQPAYQQPQHHHHKQQQEQPQSSSLLRIKKQQLQKWSSIIAMINANRTENPQQMDKLLKRLISESEKNKRYLEHVGVGEGGREGGRQGKEGREGKKNKFGDCEHEEEQEEYKKENREGEQEQQEQQTNSYFRQKYQYQKPRKANQSSQKQKACQSQSSSQHTDQQQQTPHYSTNTNTNTNPNPNKQVRNLSQLQKQQQKNKQKYLRQKQKQLYKLLRVNSQSQSQSQSLARQHDADRLLDSSQLALQKLKERIQQSRDRERDKERLKLDSATIEYFEDREQYKQMEREIERLKLNQKQKQKYQQQKQQLHKLRLKIQQRQPQKPKQPHPQPKPTPLTTPLTTPNHPSQPPQKKKSSFSQDSYRNSEQEFNSKKYIDYLDSDMYPMAMAGMGAGRDGAGREETAGSGKKINKRQQQVLLSKLSGQNSRKLIKGSKILASGRQYPTLNLQSIQPTQQAKSRLSYRSNSQPQSQSQNSSIQAEQLKSSRKRAKGRGWDRERLIEAQIRRSVSEKGIKFGGVDGVEGVGVGAGVGVGVGKDAGSGEYRVDGVVGRNIGINEYVDANIYSNQSLQQFYNKDTFKKDKNKTKNQKLKHQQTPSSDITPIQTLISIKEQQNRPNQTKFQTIAIIDQKQRQRQKIREQQIKQLLQNQKQLQSLKKQQQKIKKQLLSQQKYQQQIQQTHKTTQLQKQKRKQLKIPQMPQLLPRTTNSNPNPSTTNKNNPTKTNNSGISQDMEILMKREFEYEEIDEEAHRVGSQGQSGSGLGFGFGFESPEGEGRGKGNGKGYRSIDVGKDSEEQSAYLEQELKKKIKQLQELRDNDSVQDYQLEDDGNQGDIQNQSDLYQYTSIYHTATISLNPPPAPPNQTKQPITINSLTLPKSQPGTAKPSQSGQSQFHSPIKRNRSKNSHEELGGFGLQKERGRGKSREFGEGEDQRLLEEEEGDGEGNQFDTDDLSVQVQVDGDGRRFGVYGNEDAGAKYNSISRQNSNKKPKQQIQHKSQSQPATKKQPLQIQPQDQLSNSQQYQQSGSPSNSGTPQQDPQQHELQPVLHRTSHQLQKLSNHPQHELQKLQNIESDEEGSGSLLTERSYAISELIVSALSHEFLREIAKYQDSILVSFKNCILKKNKIKRAPNKPKKNGFATNQTQIKSFVENLGKFVIAASPQILRNLQKATGPSALQMLRYMHQCVDNDIYIEEQQDDPTIMILPHWVFQQYWSQRLITLKYDRQGLQEEKERQRQQCLKGLNKIFLRSCFDCLNQCLDYQRNYGPFGKPFPWKKSHYFPHKKPLQQSKKSLSRAQKRLLDISSTYCGIIIEKQQIQSIGGNQEYISQVQQDRLSRMLAQDLVQGQDRWIFYDDEETELLVEASNTIFHEIVEEVMGEIVGWGGGLVGV